MKLFESQTIKLTFLYRAAFEIASNSLQANTEFRCRFSPMFYELMND